MTIGSNRRPARIVTDGDGWQLRAGRRGTGRVVAEASASDPGAIDALREAAGRANLYVWAVDRPGGWHAPMRALGVAS